MTSTEARKAFGRLLEIVGRDGVVRIKKYGIAKAVVMSVNRYQALTGVSDPAPDLDALTVEFDAMLERMQSPGMQEAMLAALRASPEELGRAALAAAQQTSG